MKPSVSLLVFPHLVSCVSVGNKLVELDAGKLDYNYRTLGEWPRFFNCSL